MYVPLWRECWRSVGEMNKRDFRKFPPILRDCLPTRELFVKRNFLLTVHVLWNNPAIRGMHTTNNTRNVAGRGKGGGNKINWER